MNDWKEINRPCELQEEVAAEKSIRADTLRYPPAKVGHAANYVFPGTR